MTIYHALDIAMVLYSVLLAATVWLARPNRRRLLGALAGGTAVAVLGIGIESFFHSLGVWRYPSVEQPAGPALLYPLAAIVFTMLALVGWRVTRRWGWRGQATLLAILTIFGVLRDFLAAEHVLGIIVFAPGFATILIDAGLWAGLVALAQAVMRVVAGPAGEDRLGERPWASRRR